MLGIDLSHWNGNIDFRKVKDNIYGTKVDFAILQSNHSDVADPKFDEYYKGCIDNGIKTGAYIYCCVTDIDHAIKEANKCVEMLKNKKMPLGVWLDLEDDSMSKLGKSKLHEIIRTESDIIKCAGFKVGIYSNKNWYANILKGNELANDFDFWMASIPYDDKGVPYEKINPVTYKGCKIWQYSWKGKIDGINSNVDMDKIVGDLEEVKTPYIIGKDYMLCDDVNVRKYPGITAPLVGYNNLTPDGKAHDKNKNGSLDKGTIVTCLEVVAENEFIWLRCPSGWVCAVRGEEVYIY